MTTCTQNFESTKKKYEQAKTKLEQKGGEELQQKCDLSKTAFDDSVKELSKAQTGYSVALRSFLDQDRQLGAPLVDLVTEQINFHRTSLMILEQMMPKLESVYHEMGTSEGRVFGGTLPETGVPEVLLHCCACINREGLEEEGIFRRAGAASQIRKLREGFSKGSADLSSPANYGGDIHAVAAIIKAYFRELHEPLLITTFFNSWVEAVYVVTPFAPNPGYSTSQPPPPIPQPPIILCTELISSTASPPLPGKLWTTMRSCTRCKPLRRRCPVGTTTRSASSPSFAATLPKAPTRTR